MIPGVIRDFFQRDKSRVWLAVLLAGVLVVECFIALVFFKSYPYSMDEYNYLYQSRLFASGRLYDVIEPWAEGFRTGYMVVYNNHLFSKYPPGWAAVMAIGALVGAEALVNPVLSTCIIGLLFMLLKPRFGRRIALTAALLVGTNSYFLGYGASMYAQTLCLLLATVELLLVTRYVEAPRPALLVTMGLVAGLTFIVRPLDGFCIAAAAGLAVMQKDWRQTLQAAIRMGLPFVCCVLALYSYHWVIARCFCIASYRIWDMEFHVDYPDAVDVASYIYITLVVYWNHVVDYMVPIFLNKLVPYAGPGFMFLVLMGMCRRPGRVGVFCLAHLALTVGLYNFHPTLGFPFYGARYWYACLAGFAFFAACSLQTLRRVIAPRLQLALIGLLVFIQLFQAAGDFETYGRRFAITVMLRDQLEADCPEPSAVYILPSYVKEDDWPEYVYPWDLRRNGDLRGPRYFMWRPSDLAMIEANRPGIPLCNWGYKKGTFPTIDRVVPRLNWDVGRF